MDEAAASPTRWPGRWHRLRLSIPAAAEDRAMGLLGLHRSLGAASKAAGPGRVELEGWFDAPEQALAAGEALSAIAGAETLEGHLSAISDDGWLEASLTPREPILAGRYLVIDPSAGARKRDPELTQLRVPLGRAFGTGEHETTRLCLEWLSSLAVENRAFLDLGTGSGILALAAAISGARPVMALDNDPAVLEVAAENFELNAVADVVELRLGSWGDIDSERRFCFVFANIHRTASQRAARALARRIETGGCAVLSGFLSADTGMVREAWRREGFDGAESRELGEWAALRVWRGAGAGER